MQQLEQKINSIFIDAPGLTDELVTEVPIEQITAQSIPHTDMAEIH